MKDMTKGNGDMGRGDRVDMSINPDLAEKVKGLHLGMIPQVDLDWLKDGFARVIERRAQGTALPEFDESYELTSVQEREISSHLGGELQLRSYKIIKQLGVNKLTDEELTQLFAYISLLIEGAKRAINADFTFEKMQAARRQGGEEVLLEDMEGEVWEELYKHAIAAGVQKGTVSNEHYKDKVSYSGEAEIQIGARKYRAVGHPAILGGGVYYPSRIEFIPAEERYLHPKLSESGEILTD